MATSRRSFLNRAGLAIAAGVGAALGVRVTKGSGCDISGVQPQVAQGKLTLNGEEVVSYFRLKFEDDDGDMRPVVSDQRRVL